jgi:hypothetical protein
MMKRLNKLVPLVAVGAVLVLTLLPATAPANTPAGTISFAGNGSLLDDGTVDVTLHYSCLPPGPGEIDVALDEGGTAFAFVISPLATCDGRTHSVTVNMAPGPFTPGTATGNATVFNFDGQVVASTSDRLAIK